MRREWASRIVVVVLLLSLVLCFSSQPAGGVDLYKPFKLLAQPFEASHREKPKTGKDCSIEQLANQIDWLEHYIDKYGTIVAKHPDVWGESRLMRHRYEYEQQMAAQLDQFEVRMNAALRRSDQSFLGMAFALQAAAGSELNNANARMAPPTTTEATTDLMIVQGLISSPTDEPKQDGDAAIISRNLPFNAETGLGGFTYENTDLSLEPTIQLDQMSRYLNHLHELRRINEGDDIADSPGYALNLVRIPVSVLPGRQTRKGYGAEITITAEPYLSDELLPTTFRNLVINDVVDQLAYPMTRVINSHDELILGYLELIWQQHFADASGGTAGQGPQDVRLSPHDFNKEQTPVTSVSMLGEMSGDTAGSRLDALMSVVDERSAAEGASPLRTRPQSPAAMFAPDVSGEWGKIERLGRAVEHDVAPTLLQAFSVPVSRSRRSQLPMAPTRVLEVFDLYLLGHVAADAQFGLHRHPVNQDQLHLMDVRAFLTEELAGAYDFLESQERIVLWSLAGPNLASAIRSRDRKRLNGLRNDFLKGLGIGADAKAKFTEANTTIALAWTILVHASLLNERLIQDIEEASVTGGCSSCLADVEGLDFYNPQPSDLARMAFKEYVKCRWPIRVFALDPVTQDQNVADAFARRRELQVAAAVAFASGQMRAQALTRFTRRLEWDMATIALNRTVVAFSHGNDTFGWRFQPRFQTPPTPGTLQAFGETLLGGPTRDCDMSQRELESGLRECTAIVVMPSFVPYATFDVRTNWYKLTDPKCTEMSMRETMELSRAITSMRSSAAQCAQCAHLYREGEVARMLRRVDQLDRELPLQTMRVQIPYENTSGGFEMFNRGITELAPELIGWYGAPGVDLQNPTTMFLVGDGFSVHDTRVIAGGRVVPFKLISRQLMQVEIPTGLQVLQRGRSQAGGEFNPASLEEIVDVHLATPYGVSSHLLVPVASVGAATPAVHHFEMRRDAELTFFFERADTGVVTIDSYFQSSQNAIVVRAPRIAEVNDAVSITFFVRESTEKTYLGSFQVDSVPLNKPAYEYYISASKLTELATGTDKLGSKLKSFLEHEKSRTRVAVEVTAVLSANGMPIAGSFSAECVEKK